QLQAAAGRIDPAVGGEVGPVAAVLPDGRDLVGGRFGFAGRLLRKPGQAQVQGGPAAVAGDFEHVVFVRADHPVAHHLGALAEVGDVLRSSSEGSMVTVCGARWPSSLAAMSGTGRARSSAVLMSAQT